MNKSFSYSFIISNLSIWKRHSRRPKTNWRDGFLDKISDSKPVNWNTEDLTQRRRLARERPVSEFFFWVPYFINRMRLFIMLYRNLWIYFVLVDYFFSVSANWGPSRGSHYAGWHVTPLEFFTQPRGGGIPPLPRQWATALCLKPFFLFLERNRARKSRSWMSGNGRMSNPIPI